VKFLMLCALAGALLFAACGSGDDDNRGDGATATAAPTQQTQQTPAASTASCAKTTGDPMAQYSEPAMTIDQNKQYFATIKMDIGDIRLELYPKEAPRHVNSFVFLSREGYYDGVAFHRVLPGFVAQGGDPTGTGRGGPGYTVPLEVNPARKHVDGALAAARTQDPNSAGSQFFIDYGPQPALDPGGNGPGYTVFGGIVEGRDVLDKITARDPSKPSDLAIPCTKINTIAIEEM
jgi:cyclophilin family peptidyl-prolyl cis-trans isomerase